MKPLTNIIMWTIRAVVVFVSANLMILAFGLWEGNDTAESIFLLCLAVALFLWPDPKPKLNNQIQNPYHHGRK